MHACLFYASCGVSCISAYGDGKFGVHASGAGLPYGSTVQVECAMIVNDARAGSNGFCGKVWYGYHDDHYPHM